MMQVTDRIKSAKKILVVIAYPDADSVVSGILTARVLESLGKSVTVTCYIGIGKYSELPYSDLIEVKDVAEMDLSHFDLAITLDAPGIHMLVGPKYRKTFAFPERLDVISIDHHKTFTKFTDLTINIASSSTSTLVYNVLIKPFAYEMTKEDATLLYLSMADDTGFFKYEVHDDTFEVAHDAFKKGADTTFAANFLEYSNDLSFYKYLLYVLPRIKFDEKIGLMVLSISFEDTQALEKLGVQTGRLKELNELYNDIVARTYKGYGISILLTEFEKGHISGSMRGNNYTNKDDLSEIASKLSPQGGGHFNAAGFMVSGISSEVVMNRIYEYLNHSTSLY